MGTSAEELSEEELRFAFRWTRLRKLGLDPDQADIVAVSQIDLHEFEDLMAKGCPYHLAVRICS